MSEDIELSTVTQEDIVDAIRSAGERFGTNITSINQFEFATEYSEADVLSVFETWSDAKCAAGVNDNNIIKTEQLLTELRRVTSEIGHPPSTIEFDEYGVYSYDTYNNRFDSWKDALDEAGVTE